MKRRAGFTLIELIVVIIIVGILGTLGFTQYAKTIEIGRSAEAKTILGQIRTAQTGYYLENAKYTANLSELGISAPDTGSNSDLTTHACSNTNFFFDYTGSLTGGAWANRCTSGGKNPNATPGSGYSLWMNVSGGTGASTGYSW